MYGMYIRKDYTDAKLPFRFAVHGWSRLTTYQLTLETWDSSVDKLVAVSAQF